MYTTSICVSIVLGGLYDAPELFNSFLIKEKGEISLLSNDEITINGYYSDIMTIAEKCIRVMFYSNTHGYIQIINCETGELIRMVNLQ